MKEVSDQSLQFYVSELVFRRGATVDHTLTEIAALPTDEDFESQMRLLRIARHFHRFNQELSHPLAGVFISFLLKLLILSFDFCLGLIVFLSRCIQLMQKTLNKCHNSSGTRPTVKHESAN